jgi:hypothetical protein
MPLLLYLWGKILQYPLDRRLGGLQSWSGHCGTEKNLFPLQGIEHWPFSLQPIRVCSELFLLSTVINLDGLELLKPVILKQHDPE